MTAHKHDLDLVDLFNLAVNDPETASELLHETAYGDDDTVASIGFLDGLTGQTITTLPERD